jgi:hypothetical protein
MHVRIQNISVSYMLLYNNVMNSGVFKLRRYERACKGEQA